MHNLTLLLPYQPPWHWHQFHGHFAVRAVAGLEALSASSYSRGFELDGSAGWFQVSPLPGQNALELRCRMASPTPLANLQQRVRRMFDLDSDPLHIASHLGGDARLAPLLQANPGLRLPVAFDPFEQAVRAIVGQQVTVKAAVTIVGRLVQRLGAPLPFAGSAISHLFPTPQALAEADLAGI